MTPHISLSLSVNSRLCSTELNYSRSVSRLLLPHLDCVFYHSKLTFMLLLLLFFHRSHRSCWAIYFNPCHGMAYSLAKLGCSNFTIAMRWKHGKLSSRLSCSVSPPAFTPPAPILCCSPPALVFFVQFIF